MVRKEMDKEEILEKISDLCNPLTPEQREHLTENLTVYTYRKNEAIYSEGEFPTQLMCLLSGKVKIFKNGVSGRNQIIRVIKPVEYFAYRNKIYPPAAPGETYEPMSLTYQPLTLQEKGLDKLGGIRYKTKWYPNGATTQAMYLTVMHRPDDNGLDFNFEHQVKAVSREKLEYLYYYLCKIMFKGAENPDLPIGDIIKLV